jgi:hypothetical protein
MLWSDDTAQASRGAQLLEVLGLVKGPEEVLELCELNGMRREEMVQRQRERLLLVKAAIAAKKKGKGKKKGGVKRK